MKKLIPIISVVMIVLAVGCASLSELMTPAKIDTRAVKYVEESGISEPGEFEGYANLDKANRLAQAVVAAYETNQLALQQLIEQDQLDYTLLNEVVVKNQKNAQILENKLFNPVSGVLPILFTALGVGPLAGMIGLARKRPGDITPQDMELALQDVKQEITEKDKSILELIKGFQEVLNSCDESMAKIHKKTLAVAQSSDTKETVAKIKATL